VVRKYSHSSARGGKWDEWSFDQSTVCARW
jgi:hypothetical protein